jgi:hypothetical protein
VQHLPQLRSRVRLIELWPEERHDLVATPVSTGCCHGQVREQCDALRLSQDEAARSVAVR